MQRVLYLTTVYPGHRKTGGDVCSQSYIDALRGSGVEVDVVCFLRPGDKQPQQAWEHVAEVRSIESAEAGRQLYFWLLKSVLSGTPYSAEKYRSAAYLQLVASLCSSNQYQFCVLDHASRLTWVLPHLPASLPVVANTHNIEHRLYQRLQRSSSSMLKRWVYAREARLVEAIERSLPARVREIWTVTPEDGAYFSSLPNPPKVRAFETPPADFEIPQAAAKRYDVGLLGNWQWVANREGLEWFVKEVTPKLPDLDIEVAGKGADWLEGLSPRLKVRGFVEDSRRFLCEARVIAIASTSGAGVQIKTLEAIALGMPVVATTVAVRGIRELPATVKVADDPARFAELLQEAVAKPVSGPDSAALAWADNLRRQYRGSMQDALHGFAALT